MLAAGTYELVDLFNKSALQLHGPTDHYKSFDASGGVVALAFLEDKGLAAGTAAGSEGRVDLFNTSALKLHGPTDPYKSLDASGCVSALAVLEDTSGANREQFNSNTMQ